MIGGLIMVHSDDFGLVLPPKIAPKQVVIIKIGNSEKIDTLASEYLNKLRENNISCYIDETDRTPGYKFAEAETNGIPVRIELGLRDLEKNQFTLVRRDTREKISKDINSDIVLEVNSLMEDIQNNLYNKALKRRNEMTYTATNMDEMREIMENHPGFVKAMWCGKTECEEKIKEIKGTKSRCIPFDEEQISDKCVCCGEKAKNMVIWGIQY